MPLTPQQAIYEITHAVYASLGDNADRQLVESLVTNIFNSIYPSLVSAQPVSDNAEKSTGKNFGNSEVTGQENSRQESSRQGGSRRESNGRESSGAGSESAKSVEISAKRGVENFSLEHEWQGGDRNEDPRAQRYIISVFGLDQPGIVAAVASMVAEAQCSIIDINQTVVQRKFAMIMIIDATRTTRDMAKLRDEFRVSGERLGVRIFMQREDIFHAMHRV